MRTKWLWTIWAHLALAVVVVLEVAWLAYAALWLVPRFQKLKVDGVIDPAFFEDRGPGWAPSFLDGLRDVADRYSGWLLLIIVGVCGLFEWRVRSQNKSLIRLSVWGTAAVGLMVVGGLTAVALVVPYQLSAPVTGQLAGPFARQRVASINLEIYMLEVELANTNYKSVQEHADRASQMLSGLILAAPAVRYLEPKQGPRKLEDLRAQLKEADGFLAEAQQAAGEQDAERVKTAVRRFRELFGPFDREQGRIPLQDLP